MSLRVTNAKLWFSYVEQLLSKGLKFTVQSFQVNYSALTRIRMFQYYIAIQIIAFWKKATEVKPPEPTPCFAYDMRLIYYTRSKTMHTLTIGTLSKVGLTGQFYSPVFQQQCWGIFELQHEWHFALHKKFHLNLTFHQFKIIIGNLDSCALGSLTLKPKKNARKRDRLQFCGSYGFLPVYYNHNLFSVMLQIERFVSFDIFFVYMVLDSNRITSVPLPKVPPALRASWCLKYLEILEQLVHFELHCEKYQVLHLSFPPDFHKYKITVFDGPSTKASRVTCKTTNTKHPVHCITSSFHASVNFVKSVRVRLKLRFQQKVEDKEIIENLFVGLSASFAVGYFPEKSPAGCTNTDISCVWQSSALSGHILNITFSFHNSSNDSSLCPLGCFSVFDVSTNATTQISQLCFTNHTRQEKSVYSSAEHALMVLHKPKEHCGHFVVDLLVNSVACRLTRVDLCEHHDAVVSISMPQFISNETQCHVIQPYFNISDSQFKSIKAEKRKPRFARDPCCTSVFPLRLPTALAQKQHFTGYFDQGMFGQCKKILFF